MILETKQPPGAHLWVRRRAPVSWDRGANCGIGYETARSLAHHGCEIIFACRNRSSAEAAIERIAQERPAARSRCRFAALDLSSLRSVQRFVEEIKQSVRSVA